MSTTRRAPSNAASITAAHWRIGPQLASWMPKPAAFPIWERRPKMLGVDGHTPGAVAEATPPIGPLLAGALLSHVGEAATRRSATSTFRRSSRARYSMRWWKMEGVSAGVASLSNCTWAAKRSMAEIGMNTSDGEERSVRQEPTTKARAEAAVSARRASARAQLFPAIKARARHATVASSRTAMWPLCRPLTRTWRNRGA
mmetsp:Transcript_577/g.2406  ORF Transcript_577/g.2406 Transcript_577/m.2406 type:complete len:200 (-) Transcript_577:4463-5062(-)